MKLVGPSAYPSEYGLRGTLSVGHCAVIYFYSYLTKHCPLLLTLHVFNFAHLDGLAL